MPITQKGIPPYTPQEPTVADRLFGWLQQLQLRFPAVSTFQVSLNPSNVPASDEITELYTVDGLNAQDIVVVNPPALAPGVGLSYANAPNDNTLAITWRNYTGVDINLPSGTFRILAVRI